MLHVHDLFDLLVTSVADARRSGTDGFTTSGGGNGVSVSLKESDRSRARRRQATASAIAPVAETSSVDLRIYISDSAQGRGGTRLGGCCATRRSSSATLSLARRKPRQARSDFLRVKAMSYGCRNSKLIAKSFATQLGGTVAIVSGTRTTACNFATLISVTLDARRFHGVPRRRLARQWSERPPMQYSPHRRH